LSLEDVRQSELAQEQQQHLKVNQMRFISQNQRIDVLNKMKEKGNRCSPMCRDEILKLYLEGWSIKDLVNRFGMLPARIKAIIWMRHKLYFEIMPLMNYQWLRQSLVAEQQYN